MLENPNVAQILLDATNRLATILGALVSDAPDSKFDSEIIEWRKRVAATVKRNLVPSQKTCACTEFDDRTKFELSAFAGGGSKTGAFSYVHCTETLVNGATIQHRFVSDTVQQHRDRIVKAIPQCYLDDAKGDAVEAIELMDTAIDAARAAEFKCCPRNAWGDGDHDPGCPHRSALKKIEELERRLSAVRSAVEAPHGDGG